VSNGRLKLRSIGALSAFHFDVLREHFPVTAVEIVLDRGALRGKP
jgi:hypothetical protein